MSKTRYPIPDGCNSVQVLVLRELAPDRPQCETPDKIASLVLSMRASDPTTNPDVETLYVVALDSRRRVTAVQRISDGILDTVLSHPREIFRPAILLGAHAICLAHNHPSGDVKPSESDIRMTRDICRAGELLRISLLDHIIIADAGRQIDGRAFNSLRELGYFYA